MRKRSLMFATIIFLTIVGFSFTNARFRENTFDTPQWREQKQDASVIPQGGYVALQADSSDALSLHEAVLSTNETGVWKNETTSSLLWAQNSVYGFDNFGTATYREGMLYAPSKGDDRLYAVNASNGSIIWNTTVRQCDGSPCIDGDVVYVGECMGVYGEPTPSARAMALNRTNGEEIWHFIEPNNNTWVGSPLVEGQYVYYTTSYYDTSYPATGCGVYALNKTTGDVLWEQDVGNIIGSVACHAGMIFTSAYNPPGQYALNATTGERIWNQTYGASWDSSPVICEGMLIQVAYDPATRVWSTYVMNETNGEFIEKFAKGGCSTPLAHEGKVFIPNRTWDDLRIYAYNLSTGEELWHTAQLHNGILQNMTYCSPAAAGGAIYYQALNGTFYTINETDGEVFWSYPLPSTGFGSPSIGDGCVFITNDGGLYAFQIGPGSGDWPMFCQNQVHTSYSEHGVEYVRWPLTQPQFLGDVSNTWVTAKFVWCNKTVISAAIAWRIYFLDGAGNSNVTDTKVFYVNVPLHDVAVVSIVPTATVIEQNQTVQINVTASNLGNYTETFNVTLYFDSTGVGLQTLTLSASDSRILTFQWNTTRISCADYSLKAVADTVPGETSVLDNVCTLSSVVTVVPELAMADLVLLSLGASTSVATILMRKEKRH